MFDGDVRWLATLTASTTRSASCPGPRPAWSCPTRSSSCCCPPTRQRARLRRARRDKWTMAQAVAAAGVPHLRQFCSADADEIAAWFADAGLRIAALVVKPPKSVATDEVHVVPAGEDLRPLVARIVRTRNVGGLSNDERAGAGVRRGHGVPGRHLLGRRPARAGRRLPLHQVRAGATGSASTTGSTSCRPTHPEVTSVWPYTHAGAGRARVPQRLRARRGHADAERSAADRDRRAPAGGGHQMITELGHRRQPHPAHRRAPGPRRVPALATNCCSTSSAVFISAPRAGTWRNAEIFDEVDALPTFWRKHFPKGTGDVVAAPRTCSPPSPGSSSPAATPRPSRPTSAGSPGARAAHRDRSAGRGGAG